MIRNEFAEDGGMSVGDKIRVVYGTSVLFFLNNQSPLTIHPFEWGGELDITSRNEKRTYL